MSDLKPTYRRENGTWVKKTAFERQNGQWVKISSVASSLAAGLYETGTANLIYSWEQLLGDEILEGGVVHVTDGVLTTNSKIIVVPSTNKSSDYLAGNLVLPSDGSILSLGKVAFAKCYKLSGITIPNSVVSIAQRAFQSCESLTSITIPDGVTALSDYMVYGCTALEAITIPDSVTSSATYTFSGCENLKRVYITDIAAWCGIEFGSLWQNPLYYGADLYINGKLATDLTIPNSVKEIYGYTFNGTGCIKTITISEGVTTIRDSAFNRCYGLETINIPTSITTIEDYAFFDCNLQSLFVPDSVTSLGSGITARCDSLSSIEVSESNPTYCSIDGIVFNKDKTTILIYPQGRAGESYTIPSGVTEIGVESFYGANFTSVNITDGVTTIREYAFSYCESLSRVTIPASVTTIRGYAFTACMAVEEVNYLGTVAQWNAIDKASTWNSNSSVTEVVCSDGTVAL